MKQGRKGVRVVEAMCVEGKVLALKRLDDQCLLRMALHLSWLRHSVWAVFEQPVVRVVACMMILAAC